jgi:hypothetical protein
MKTTILKSMMAVLMALSSLSVYAYDVKVYGIYYNLNKEEKTAEVTMGDKKYSGNISIPTSIKHDDVTYDVTSIGVYAFANCSGLTSVTIPNSVTAISAEAFYDCSELAAVNVTNSITIIDGSAFEGTAWYNNQPDGLIYVGNVLYKYKGNMPKNTSIAIKDGTTSICDNAFENCKNLISVDIPNSVTSIGDDAFSGCSGLTSVTIPNSVSSIGVFAFYNCI